MKPCDFYGCDPDAESYSHTDRDEAIKQYLGDMLWPKMSLAEVLAALPNTVTVYGFRRRVLTPDDIGSPLDDVLERLADDEFGDPDGDDYAGVERMRAAEAVFIAVILAGYEVRSCEEDKSAREVVEVMPWVRAHRPEWLEGAK